jgi:fructose PTS system EIIBC or EIIC component
MMIAADTHVDLSRFSGKPLHQISVGSAVKQAGQLIGAALAAPAVRSEAARAAAKPKPAERGAGPRSRS